MSLQWLDWARRIQALSQAGLTFSKDEFDLERYTELQQISAEILATYSEHSFEKINQLFANEEGYQTPKVDVRGVVFEQGKILMVQEKADGKWSLPGGFCEVGLSPTENVVKEIEEEAGYRTKAKKLLALLDMNKHFHPPQPYHYYKVFIECEVDKAVAMEGLETSQVKFFREDGLPPLSENRNTKEQIEMLFELRRNEGEHAIVD
ncbi:ADP-ribose pyrophosphatase [Alkalihalobacillus alcalophilus ATCC 27647 = CGMCC 1.3604]|uniref:ADP-ribose pyrophosphatase n=1 Tax=Alkalihalobacillus alcalophilus ATCC 27647 = CGMCC 1.3604 TaxID=1218173 RepID=A0A094WI29_ALKAL|nr:NUDIX hydrolase [Alkalihalobacillus alcalophilus]KGA96471.1 ADP-ribose pyrophosphatase [Alkalihalobacillus alcalophilus ATCC 27647 = CGMCC 1.3604]MED1562325.1 NUDIX hydrolase [Alkalihalobacillus alcalophilus]THG90354.1 ADP-ribose pyrophosphatase [Alkalihalobacillus alcalophilus ATCC 27647 = CGMCC 1.3604]